MMTCIVLAAGESRRFGSPKPLADLNGTPAIRQTVNTVLASVVKDVIVVLGHEARNIQPLVPEDSRVRVVINKDYNRGMTSSFQTALNALADEPPDLMLLPADMPFVKAATIDLLCRTFETQRPLILVPTYRGRSGHPPVFASSLIEEFKSLKDSDPLSTIQRRHSKETLHLPVNDEGIVQAFNTPQELSRLLRDHP